MRKQLATPGQPSYTQQVASICTCPASRSNVPCTSLARSPPSRQRSSPQATLLLGTCEASTDMWISTRNWNAQSILILKKKVMISMWMPFQSGRTMNNKISNEQLWEIRGEPANMEIWSTSWLWNINANQTKKLDNINTYGSVSKPCTPVVHIKIAGKWMFIPLKMVLIDIDPYPY